MATLVACFLAGSLAGRGVAGWSEFAANLRKHQGTWSLNLVGMELLVLRDSAIEWPPAGFAADIQPAPEHGGYTVVIPDRTPHGQTVIVQRGDRGGVHVLHAESPDQSELYFEVTTYGERSEHRPLIVSQQELI